MSCNKGKKMDGDTSAIEEDAINNMKKLSRRRVIITRES
jgi:hypothetical protein